MRKKRYCRLCARELTGSIEAVWIDVGIFTYVVSRDSAVCNWRQCKGCGDVLCKDCYARQPKYCCYEDRIVCRERAQTIGDSALVASTKHT